MPEETLEKEPVLSWAERDIIAFVLGGRDYVLLNVGIARCQSKCKSKKYTDDAAVRTGEPEVRELEGNYEQVVIWEFSAKKAKFWGECM